MKVRIGLKSHQQPMAENIDTLYSNGKNFAGIILATGGGKSFIAMDQIIKFAENYNDRNPLTEEQENQRILSAVPGYYICPQNPISLQFRIHMISNIIGPEHIIRYEEKNGLIQEGQEIQVVKDIMQTMAPELDLEKIEFEKLYDEVNGRMSGTEDVQKSAVVQRMIAEIVSQYKNNDLKKVVDAAFPNLNFITYKALENKTDKDFKKMKADFIIIDEAHRSGAEKWWPKIQSFIKNSGAKVLSITATPERDVDEKDMMRDLALLKSSGYSVREVRGKEHLAGNMPLLNSIEGGHISPPDVVHFNCKLDETPEFEKAVKAFIQASLKVNSMRSSSNSYYNAMNTKSEIENALVDMLVLIRKDPLIDYDDSLTPEEKEAKKIADEENVRKQINERFKYGEEKVTVLSQLKNIVSTGAKEKKSEAEILTQCMEIIRSPEWEKLKKERVTTIISKEIKARNLENSKAINFMEAMEGQGKETKEQKMTRARFHVEKHIEKLKEMFDGKIIKMPKFIALHSTAFTAKENDDNLEEFMEKGESGIMKIITAVSKFNEGFHADGVRALLMTTPIQPNENKEYEPRIKLLQQIGRCLSAGKKEVSVIFDTACNFMRNHEKFKAECEKDCFAFLRLSKEEEMFKKLADRIKTSKRAVSAQKPDTDKLMTILEILKNNNIKVDSSIIQDNMTLSEYISTISDEETRENLLDNLFLQEIEMERDGEFDLGRAYRYTRNVYLGIEEDSATLKKISPKTLKEMLDLGVIETKTEEGKNALNGRINRAGFIVRGIVTHTFAYNVYTGTKFDGPETDPDRKDYFGCGPDGRDPAGYDRYGFDQNGIHRVTGKNFDERHFSPVKGEDGKISWKYVDPKTGEKSETDPLGFNYEGINPETGFDRQGYWHRQGEDGEFSIIKSKLNEAKEDAHHFVFNSISENLGLYFGEKMNFKNERGLHSNGSLFERGIIEVSDRYGYDGFDIDGFDRKGFDSKGFHRDTSVEYGLDGKDKNGIMQVDLKITTEILNLLKSGKLRPEELPKRIGRSAEEVDEVIANAFSISRTLNEISGKKGEKDGSDVIGLLAMVKESPKAVDKLFELSPSMRKQVEKALLDNRTMNKYCSERINKLLANFTKAQTVEEVQEIKRVGDELGDVETELKNSTGSVPFRRPDEDDFVL